MRIQYLIVSGKLSLGADRKEYDRSSRGLIKDIEEQTGIVEGNL
jgi:hypothetical protein